MKRRRHNKASCDEDGDDLSPTERVCALLRGIQWETNCSTLTLQRFLDSLRGNIGQAVNQCKTLGLELPRSVKSADKKMKDTVCKDIHSSYNNYITLYKMKLIYLFSTRLALKLFICTDVFVQDVTKFGARPMQALSVPFV